MKSNHFVNYIKLMVNCHSRLFREPTIQKATIIAPKIA